MSRPQFFPIQLKLDVKEWHFCLAIGISSNPINFINAHPLHSTSPRNHAHWQRWMDYSWQLWLAENGIYSPLVKAERENFRPRHSLTKCSLEDKLLNQKNCWSWYNFSQEKLPHTLIPIITFLYCWKYYAVPFFYGPPCINFIAQCSIKIHQHMHVLAIQKIDIKGKNNH